MSKATYQSVIRDNSGVPIEEQPNIQTEEQFNQEQNKQIRQLELQQWKQQSLTIELFRELSSEIEKAETRARQLATTYHTHNNHQEIINLLIKAETYRTLRNNYA